MRQEYYFFSVHGSSAIFFERILKKESSMEQSMIPLRNLNIFSFFSCDIQLIQVNNNLVPKSTGQSVLFFMQK